MNFQQWFKITSEWNLNEVLALKGNYKGNIFQRLVAAQYMISPTLDPEAIPAFEDLKQKITRQSQFLKSKFDMYHTKTDPYSSMKIMTQDIDKQKSSGIKRPRVPVYAAPPASGHPFFTNDDNVMQRGVHDIISHYFGQHPFSARGEYAAYNRHLKTLCNQDQAKSGKCLAAKAIFTEVVAQISVHYIYGDYAKQKVVILNDFDHYYVGRLNPVSILSKLFVEKGKTLMPANNFTWERFHRVRPALAEEMKRQEDPQQVQGNVPLQPIED